LVKTNLRIENDINILSFQESSEQDQESRNFLEVGKQLGLYAEIEDKVIQNFISME
jgi:hypothetical protein